MSTHTTRDLPPVGTVLRPAPDGDLLVESDDEPVEPGTRCETDSGQIAGTVEDVIGPVDQPFLVVSLPGDIEEASDLEELAGTRLYPR